MARELEALGLAIMISLAMLASEILILGVYLSALRRRTSRQKLGPYLMVLYLLICCSTAVGLVSFYRGEASNLKTATRALVLVCLIPNFVIIFILIHSLGFYNVRTEDRMTQSLNALAGSHGSVHCDRVSLNLFQDAWCRLLHRSDS